MQTNYLAGSFESGAVSVLSMKLLTVNVGRPKTVEYTDAPGGATGIDKRPVDGAVRVTDPGPKGEGGSGLAGDTVCDLRHHGGDRPGGVRVRPRGSRLLGAGVGPAAAPTAPSARTSPRAGSTSTAR